MQGLFVKIYKTLMKVIKDLNKGRAITTLQILPWSISMKSDMTW